MGDGDTVGMPEQDRQFARGLEGMVDRALQRHPRGRPFAYGIHQELSPAVMEYLRHRYQAAGWSSVSLKEGATGAFLLVLAP